MGRNAEEAVQCCQPGSDGVFQNLATTGWNAHECFLGPVCGELLILAERDGEVQTC